MLRLSRIQITKFPLCRPGSRRNVTVTMVHNNYNNRPLNHLTVSPHSFVLGISSFLPVKNLTVYQALLSVLPGFAICLTRSIITIKQRLLGCSKGSVGDQNAEENVDSGGWAHEVSERKESSTGTQA